MTGRWFDHVPSGIHSARPAASAVPKYGLYACSTHGKIYQSDGTTWADWLAPTSGFADPTTTKGDLIVRTASAIARKGIGTDGTVLTADSTQTDGLAWAAAGGGGGGVLGLAIGASIPGGTPAGTLIFRKSEWFASLVADSPAALIGLDESTGNFLDASGNARHFTPGTGVTRGKSPLLPDGLASASGDGAQTSGHGIGSLASNGGIGATGTIECWARIPAGSLQGTFAHVGTSSTGWGMGIGNAAGGTGRILSAIAPGVNYLNSGYTFPAPLGSRTAIYHLAMTLAAHTYTWFVNGEPVGTNTLSELTPGAGMFISGIGGSSEFLSSTIDVDNVAFFPTVLSDARIKQHSFRTPYSLLGWYDGSKLQPLGLV